MAYVLTKPNHSAGREGAAAMPFVTSQVSFGIRDEHSNAMLLYITVNQSLLQMLPCLGLSSL